MQRTFCFRLAALLGLLVAVFPAAQLAHAGPEAPVVPSRIAVPEGHKLFLVGHAVGVQIYSCNPTATGYAWSFVAPRADLYGDNGRLIATHFVGPTWEARDGSKVVGQRVDGVTVDPSAIAWLLLSASAAPGSEEGRLTGTTYIQRLATTGGLAPAAAGCNASTVAHIEEVPYTADYTFWKRSDGD